MKVVVCQGETTGYPSRDELVALWREEIGKIPQVDDELRECELDERRARCDDGECCELPGGGDV